MRIGVTGVFQYSAFSSGMTQVTLAIAEMMRELGHEVDLLQMVDTPKTWYDDVQALKEKWRVIRAEEAKGYDLLIETDRLLLSAERRVGIARRAIWVVTHPFLLGELEASLYPMMITPKRDFTGLSEVWITEAAADAEAGDSIQALELLLPKATVRRVPTLWTPSIAATHLADLGGKTWIQATVEELKRSGSTGPMPSWRIHIAETNSGNTSSAVLPLVILREARRLGLPVERWFCHNAEGVMKSKFFLENTLKHCTDAAVGLSGEFVGRQRCVEWSREPMSLVMSHMRFRLVRPLLLDLAWAGVPVVHNSPLLRDIGHGLERLYYSGNHVGEACEALRRVGEDLVVLQGIFAPESQNAIRMKLVEQFSPLSVATQTGWRAALGPIELALKDVKMEPSVEAVVSPPPVAAAQPSERIFRLGFSDMWEDFNPEYNFFSLLVTEAGRHLTPPLKVIAGPATAESDLVIMGPFGNNWCNLPEKQPKVFFTGENTEPVGGHGIVLNLGFHHFDMVKDNYLRFPLWILEIDWFGADAARIRNPKPIPLERCTQVQAAELGRKKKFCAFVVSNPGNPVRNAAFQWLNEYKPVDSAGRVFNTLGPDLFAGGGGGGGELKKFEFLKDYKFCLAYENNSARGYTTEKYLHAKAAGTIPIYWGDPAFERDFNVAGCIDARNIRTQEELIAAVRRVDEDDSEWLKRYAVPALDSYKVAWCRRTMSELARRLLTFGGVKLEDCALPRFLGKEPVAAKAVEKEVVAAAPEAATASAPVPGTSNKPLELPLMVTCATRKFLSSLTHWLTAVGTQSRVTPGLQALVFLGSDIPTDTLAALREAHTFATFETLPDQAAPEGAFADFWAPEHYAWKIWIYNELAGREALRNRMILYTDAGSFLCRWPREWLGVAQEKGICLLEDPREENGRWCSAAFKGALKVTAAEEAAQQRLGGLVAFRAGSAEALRLFGEAYALAKRREVIAGPKWEGVRPDGRPFGHRHDQSILSILSLRQGVATVPLDTVYCDTSLRKTFLSGRCVYVHRGDFRGHRQFAPGIDEAYVINLDRRKDRLERLWASSPELQGRVDRWSAIEGRNLKLTPALARLLKPNDFFWKKAVTGCALSHLGLWWKLATDHPDIQNYLILEDDVKFRPGWEQAWKQAVENGDVPDDYDILYLGGVLPPNRVGFDTLCKERVNDSFCRIAENQVWSQPKPTRYFHFCAYAYVLSKQGAQKVMGLLSQMGGYWTSADHILCNPVDELKSYVLDPMVAGCYQDDDPKYAGADFNNFSRIDGFDSDLWNNDERFSAEEIAAATVEGTELDVPRALAEARGVAITSGAKPVDRIGSAGGTTAAREALKEELAVSKSGPPMTVPAIQNNPKLMPRRLVCLAEHNLDLSQLLECDWLVELFGKPALVDIKRMRVADPPPTDEPVLIVQRPHLIPLMNMMERWNDAGAKFHVLHLSDEYSGSEQADPVDFYELEGCRSVVRMYLREGVPCPEKVMTIPLGYHWTLREGSRDPARFTPHLPFRTLVWSFFGTEWGGRRGLLKPLMDAPGLKHEARFYRKWGDVECLKKEPYIQTLLDSVFVPCPDGMNPETFRFYEALEAGCVPVLVRTDRNAAWVDWVAEHLQLLPLSSWEEAAKFMEQVVSRPEMLEQYRDKVLTSWRDWKQRLSGAVQKWLLEGTVTKDL